MYYWKYTYTCYIQMNIHAWILFPKKKKEKKIFVNKNNELVRIDEDSFLYLRNDTGNCDISKF